MPPRLRAIPPLVVTSDRVVGDPTVTATLKLAELGRAAKLTNLHIEQLDRAVTNNAQIEAELTAKDAPAELAAGGRVAVTLEGKGFPIGTSTGQLVITADQLAEPVVVAYEVRSKRHTELIIPWFLVFGVFGWVVRHVLKNAEARAELGARLEPLRRQVQTQIETHPLEQQRLALTTLQRDVDSALDGRDHAALEAKVQALRSGLEKALAERATFVNQEAAQVTALRQALSPAWKLPGGADLHTSLPYLASAEAALVADRPRDAKDHVKPVYAALDAVGDAVNRWLVQADRTVKDLAAAHAHLPGSVRPAVETAEAIAQDKRKPVSRYDAAQRPESIATYLRQVHELYDAMEHLDSLLRVGLSEELSAAKEMATKVGMKQSDIDEIVRSGTLPESHADRSQACDRALKTAHAFHDVVEKHITETEARKLLDAGRYADAIQRQAELTKGLSRAVPTANQLQVPDVVREQVSARTATPDVPVGFVVVSMRPRSVDPITLARSHLQNIRLVRGVVSALALSLVTWAVYRGSWSGSDGDLVGLAVVAFFTDFTVDALIQAVTAVKKPGPA
jgi:hypothetical protein